MSALSSPAREEFPSRTDFASQIDSPFLINVGIGETVDAILVSLDETFLTAEQENYTLTFRAPSDSVMSQGTYDIENEGIGTFQLFVVPVKVDQHGLYLEAVINRLIKG